MVLLVKLYVKVANLVLRGLTKVGEGTRFTGGKQAVIGELSALSIQQKACFEGNCKVGIVVAGIATLFSRPA